MASELCCPVCGSDRFAPYRGRANARCSNCGSKERHRFLALVLNRLPDLAEPVFHFAPEPAIASILLKQFGRRYRPADLEPEAYSWSTVPVTCVDLCDAKAFFSPRSVGGFVHSHVFEHVPVPLDNVICELNAALVPGGFHIFQVPVGAGHFEEDLSPSCSAEERLRRFGQEDHVRRFGEIDLYERLLEAFDNTGMARVDVSKFVTRKDLLRAGVPASSLSRDTGHSVYFYLKRAPSAA